MSEKSHFSAGKIISILVGVIAYAAIILIDNPLHHLGDYGSRPAYAAAATVLMAIWWLTEAVPIYLTACVPLVLFPLTGVFGGSLGHEIAETVLPYLDAYIFLFMGGMCIGAAMQQWDLHRRIALHIMSWVGTDPKRLLAGFLAATAFISLWISNTATAAMMLPIGMAVIRQLELRLGNKRLAHYGAAIMLSIAYGSNVGGIGTKIGTAPNAQFAGFMETHGQEISFLDFALVGFPFVLMFLPITWWALWRVGRHDNLGEVAGGDTIREELRVLGPVKKAELIVLAVFAATALIWIFGAPIADLIKHSYPKMKTSYLEGGVAMLAALVLVLARVGGRSVLGLNALRGQPWATLLLLGGSFAMAQGIQGSGLSGWVGGELARLRDFSPFMQVLLASLATVGLSAVASNTATTSVMLNVLHKAVAPEMSSTVLFSATISASCDFALPAGTPPNAIVFASGYLTIPRMAKTGVLLDVLAACVSSVWCYLIVRSVL